MTKLEYINSIEEKLSYYYDISHEFNLGDEVFDLYAASNIKNSKFMGSKKLVIYAYENNSHVYIKSLDSIDIDFLKSILDKNVPSLLESTEVDDEHMSTHYTFVFITNEKIDVGIKKFVNKYRKQKSYALGFKGWSSIGVVLVSLEDGEVVYNKDAKKIYKSFKPL